MLDGWTVALIVVGVIVFSVLFLFFCGLMYVCATGKYDKKIFWHFSYM